MSDKFVLIVTKKSNNTDKKCDISTWLRTIPINWCNHGRGIKSNIILELEWTVWELQHCFSPWQPQIMVHLISDLLHEHFDDFQELEPL